MPKAEFIRPPRPVPSPGGYGNRVLSYPEQMAQENALLRSWLGAARQDFQRIAKASTGDVAAIAEQAAKNISARIGP